MLETDRMRCKTCDWQTSTSWVQVCRRVLAIWRSDSDLLLPEANQSCRAPNDAMLKQPVDPYVLCTVLRAGETLTVWGDSRGQLADTGARPIRICLSWSSHLTSSEAMQR